MMSRLLGIAGIQMNVIQGQDNTDMMLKKMNAVNTLFPWVEIIFFSELCLNGLAMKLAMPIPNPSLEKLGKWARDNKKWVIPGSFYEKEENKIFNTAVVISPAGDLIARYRKIFPWQPLETSDPGESFCVFDIPGKGRFGLCICYDQWFPELARTLALMGAEAVFCPTAWSTPDRTQELIMAQANAIANQYYWFSLNGVGAGGIGRSVFVDPEGRILQNSGEGERIMTQVIDLDVVSRVREYGTMGQCQVLKSFRDYKGKFSIYQEDMSKSKGFKNIGSLKRHTRISR